MFFGHKNKPQIGFQVDLGDLQNEKEHLTSFLQSNQVSIAPVKNKLTVNSERLSAQELQRLMIKFVYHRHFNNTHWVSIEENIVKINRFKGAAKKKEKRKKKDNVVHQTALQSWGL